MLLQIGIIIELDRKGMDPDLTTSKDQFQLKKSAKFSIICRGAIWQKWMAYKKINAHLCSTSSIIHCFSD